MFEYYSLNLTIIYNLIKKQYEFPREYFYNEFKIVFKHVIVISIVHFVQ